MSKKSIWLVFFEGLKIYVLNIHKFLLYMAFPVLGQLVGLFLIFGLTFWFTQNIQEIAVKYPALSDISTMITLIVVAVVPGLLILVKAFWGYLVAFVALNSMTEGYMNTGRVYDFRAHNSVATQKIFSFIIIWFLISIMSIISIIPLFTIIGAILFVYCCLVFQVFTFENGLSPVGYFKRSLYLVKGNFGKTFSLMAILTVLTYCLFVQGFGVLFDAFNWTQGLEKMFEAWALTLPLELVEGFGVTPSLVGTVLVKSMLSFIVIGFTMPLRSICWTLWYNYLAEDDKPVVKKPRKRTVKKSRGESKEVAKTFKIEKRGIDPEIIRRARLEDDEY